MITVVSPDDDGQLVRSARGHALGEAGWLLFHLALASFAAWVAWSEVTGVWPALFWLLAGAVAGDALSGLPKVWVAVRDWRRSRRSAAFRALTRELHQAAQTAFRTYHAARDAELAQEPPARARRGWVGR